VQREAAAPDREVLVEVAVRHESRQGASPPRGTRGRCDARRGRGGELGERESLIVRGCGERRRVLASVVGEEPTPPEVPRDAPRSVLEHTGDLVRRQAWQRVEPHLASGAFVVYAVEKYCMHVRIEAQVRRGPLHDEHGSALPPNAVLLVEAPPVEGKHGLGLLLEASTIAHATHVDA
jgi:hypothetical protein